MKPKETDFEPQTIGQHVKKKRLELGLTQRATGGHLKVTAATVFNWENGLRQPKLQHMPAIHEFLGYDPEPTVGGTIAEFF